VAPSETAHASVGHGESSAIAQNRYAAVSFTPATRATEPFSPRFVIEADVVNAALVNRHLTRGIRRERTV
jgi:hypothetical protein